MADVEVVTVETCSADVIAGPDVAAAIREVELEVFGSAEPDSGEPWGCSLAAGHAGRHVAHVLETDEPAWQVWWLRWEGGTPDFVEEPPCEADGPVNDLETGGRVLCLLPDAHEGPHAGGAEFWNGSAEEDE